MRASRNVELKAGNVDPAKALSVCESLGTEPRGLLVQEDTYFHAPVDRLKLREERAAAAHLIAYQRPDEPDCRESSYHMAPVADPATLKAVLSAALGVKAVVTKKRRLFTLGSVRIHLDAVDGLGSFVEFEAVASPESNLAKEREDVQMLREAFAISDADLISVSYCDLLGTVDQDSACVG